MPEQDAQVRARNFQEVNLGFPPEQARAGIAALHRVPQARMRREVPGVGGRARGHRLHRAKAIIWARRRRFAKTMRCRRSPAACARWKISASRDACWARRASPSASLTWSASSPTGSASRDSSALPKQQAGHGQEGRHRRQRPGGLGLRRRPHPDGTQGARVRSAARTRRRAGVRHSGVPPAERHRAPRDRDAAASAASSSRPMSWSARPSPSTS